MSKRPVHCEPTLTVTQQIDATQIINEAFAAAASGVANEQTTKRRKTTPDKRRRYTLVPLFRRPADKDGDEHVRADPVPVPDTELLIGRGPRLQVTDSRVSRSQAEIVQKDNKVYVRGLGMNPCYIRRRGQEAQGAIKVGKTPTQLCEGDVLFLLHDRLPLLLVCQGCDDQGLHEPSEAMMMSLCPEDLGKADHDHDHGEEFRYIDEKDKEYLLMPTETPSGPKQDSGPRHDQSGSTSHASSSSRVPLPSIQQYTVSPLTTSSLQQCLHNAEPRTVVQLMVDYAQKRGLVHDLLLFAEQRLHPDQ